MDNAFAISVPSKYSWNIQYVLDITIRFVPRFEQLFVGLRLFTSAHSQVLDAVISGGV